MQIISKKGVNIYRDFYIDMNVNPIFKPKILKIPISKIGESVKWFKTIGDNVTKYEIIAENGNNQPIYSMVSGTLEEISVGPQMGDICRMQYAVVSVKPDNIPSHPLWDTESSYSKEQLFEIIKKSGIINETLSDYLVNTINLNTNYKKLIIDSIDEQPFDLSRTAVLLNYQSEVIGGAKIIAEAFGINIKELLLMKNFRTQNLFKNGVDDLKLIRAKGKYPLFPEVVQYAHNQTGLLIGAQCCRAIYRAAYFGEPQISNVITVWGEGVKYPQNIEVLFGTTVKDILEHCGANGIIERVVAGGVMKGYVASAQWPIFKWNGVLTVMPLKNHHKTIECINCGRCANVCPMKLAPYYMMRPSHKLGEKIAKQLCAGMCIYCGSCSYICPSRLPITEKIREYNKLLTEGKIE